MSVTGRLGFAYTNSGATISVAVHGTDRNLIWNGAAFVAISSITDAQWRSYLLPAVNLQTSEGTKTSLYVLDTPSLPLSTEDYLVVWYAGALPAPGDRPVGVLQIEGTSSGVSAVQLDTQGENLSSSA